MSTNQKEGGTARVIKYRGKDKAGVWRYGWLFKERDNFIIRNAYLDGWYDSEVDPATVGQYTGLTDKVGKDIYEGDIIEHMVSPFCQDEVDGDVYWHKGRFRFELNTKRAAPHCLDALNTYEIIGTIHDTTELTEADNG